MKKFWKKTSLFLVTAAMTVSAPLMAWALEHDIVILHTNDIHCGINDNIGFAGLAQIKKDALARTPNVALVDAGDAIQGAPIGKLSRGLAVVDIMNYLGYDFCIPGNHEFDYGVDIEEGAEVVDSAASWSWCRCSVQAITAQILFMQATTSRFCRATKLCSMRILR